MISPSDSIERPAEEIGRTFTTVAAEGAVAVMRVTAAIGRASRARLRFHGDVRLERCLQLDLQRMVPAVLDGVVRQLLPHPSRFSLTVGLAVCEESLKEALLRSRVNDPAIGAAVLLASLSAVIELPLSQDVLVQGILASPDARFEQAPFSLERLSAAIRYRAFRVHATPSSPGDPKAADLLSDICGHSEVRPMPIRHLGDLLALATDDESVLRSAFSGGLSHVPAVSSPDMSGIRSAVVYLGAGNDERCFRVLNTYLVGSVAAERIKGLVSAWLEHCGRARRYPPGSGQHLHDLLQSVSPSRLEQPDLFPLVPARQLLSLFRHTDPEPAEDIYALIDAILGKVTGPCEQTYAGATPKAATPARGLLAAVMHTTSAESIATRFGKSINDVRDQFTHTHARETDANCGATLVEEYYAALLRATGSPEASAQSEAVRAEAHALLERAFADKGGAAEVIAELKTPVRGGAKLFLDAMKTQFQRDLASRFVRRTIQEAIQPLDWSDRVELARQLVEALGPCLPFEERHRPIAYYAARCEELLTAYVLSMKGVFG